MPSMVMPCGLAILAVLRVGLVTSIVPQKQVIDLSLGARNETNCGMVVGAAVVAAVGDPAGSNNLPAGSKGKIRCFDYTDTSMPALVCFDGWTNGNDNSGACRTTVEPCAPDSSWWVHCADIKAGTPLPPTPAPPSAAVWVLGANGQSCTTVCAGRSASCVEGLWPTTEAAFRAFAGSNCTSGVQAGSWEGNPEIQSGTCYWQGTATTRCPLTPSGARFCPCAPDGPPPPTPAPPLPTTVSWHLQSARPGGESCTATCAALDGNATCTEHHWPNTTDDFRMILEETNTTCASISSGSWAGNPDIESGSSCYWQGSGTARCAISSTSSTNRRFCPCEGSAERPPLGPPWKCKEPKECNVCPDCCEPYIEDGPDCDLCVNLKCGANYTCTNALEHFCGHERPSLPACERCAGANMGALKAANCTVPQIDAFCGATWTAPERLALGKNAPLNWP